jgi:hypothetical protein
MELDGSPKAAFQLSVDSMYISELGEMEGETDSDGETDGLLIASINSLNPSDFSNENVSCLRIKPAICKYKL